MRRLFVPGQSYFDVTWFGEDAFEFRVPKTPAGIGGRRSWFGINWLGLRRAARFAGYTWWEFCDLPGSYIASAIAEHRIENHVEALIGAWQVEKAKTKAGTK